MLQVDERKLYDEALHAIERGDLKHASELCQLILEQQPESARGYHLMSSLFQVAGNYRKAYDYAELATQMDNYVARYHMQQGHVLFALREYEQALACFERVTTLSPEDANAYLSLAECLKALERYDEAHRAYDKISTILPASSTVAAARAECFLAQGEMEEAHSTLQTHKNNYAADAQTHYLLAIIALIDGDFVLAERLLNEAITLDGQHALAHFYIALILLQDGKEKEATEHCLTVLKTSPSHVQSLLILGYIFIKQNNAESAIKAFEHVITLEPNHLLGWQNLLELYNVSKGLSEGLDKISHSIKASPQPHVLKHLRALYRGDVPPLAPRDYVAQLYNHVAVTFGYWLLAARDERALDELHTQLRSFPLLKDKPYLSLLDLGCNTGRSAELLKDRTAICVGIDLSKEMLKIARRSKRYDVLYELDVAEYAFSSETKFDVITCAGAMRWMGNVQPFFQAIRNVMYPHSLFAFTVAKEHSTLAYTVALDGRYHHNATYIEDIALAEGLEILLHKEIMWLDSEVGMLTRHLYIMKKTVLH